VTRFAYDPACRVIQETLPDGSVIGATYDADGNVAALTPPGRPAHSFSYTSTNLLQDVVPPTVGGQADSTHYTYDPDQRLPQDALPTGTTVALGYDAAGRLSSVTDPRGTETLSYDAASGHLTQLTAPDGGTLRYSFAGDLVTDATWAGTVAG